MILSIHKDARTYMLQYKTRKPIVRHVTCVDLHKVDVHELASKLGTVGNLHNITHFNQLRPGAQSGLHVLRHVAVRQAKQPCSRYAPLFRAMPDAIACHIMLF